MFKLQKIVEIWKLAINIDAYINFPLLYLAWWKQLYAG